MSTKRTSPESSRCTDEETNEGSDSLFQEDDNAKRAKLISLSDTTLQDLPMELIECILVKAVAMEVMGMKLAKSVWKEKAVLVINRLGTVCSQWSSILTTNFFRNELHRTLDRTAQRTIRLEILHQSPLSMSISKVTIMKDEIFMICKLQNGDFAINVHDRNNLAEVKDVIPLPEIQPERMAACSVSNCLYILYRTRRVYIRILRIARDDEHQFNITPLITDVWMPNREPTLSVTANGSLIVSRQQKHQRSVIIIYNADGSVQHQMMMSPDTSKFSDIIPKSNGNLVLFSTNDQMQAVLTEIDMDVTIIRQFKSSLHAYECVNHADNYGRVILSDGLDRTELLDSEFNLLEFSGPQLDERIPILNQKLFYNSDRNEVVTFTNACFWGVALTIFRFTEE